MHKFHRPDLEAIDFERNEHQQALDFARILSGGAKPVVLDVGANRGQFAQRILSICPAAKVFSFEPNPNAFEELKTWINDSGQEISAHNLAISTRQGQSNFFVTQGDEGSSLLEPIPGQPSKWLTIREEITVQTIRLDHFLNDMLADNEQVKLLKIDAQGSDLNVLESAGKFLNPHWISAVHVEINFSNFYMGQNRYHEIFHLLDHSGYRLANLYPRTAHDGWLWMGDALFITK
jgi:FkbM family methyltransferase